MQVKIWGSKAGIAFLVASTVCITALFFSAGLIYYTNPQEYSIPFLGFAKGLAQLLLPKIVVMTILLFVLPKKFNLFQKGIVVAILAAFVTYLYCSFFVWQYGMLDGKAIDWSAFRYRYLVDISIVVVFFYVLFKYWRTLYAQAVRLCLLLLAIQCFTLFLYHWTSDELEGRAEQSKFIDLTYSMDFSEKENIIFIVIDTLPANVFEEVIREDKYRDYFNSFISFTDCSAGYPTTIAAIGLMLSGEYYDNSVSLNEYYVSALSSPDSLTEFCRQNDYVINVNTHAARVFSNSFANFASNVTSSYSATSRELAGLVEAALFRSSPHAFKRFFTADRRFFDVDGDMTDIWDYQFLDAIQRFPFTKLHKKPFFGFFHLLGFHPPHRVDENFKYHKDGVKPIDQARACLNLVHVFLEKLRTSGLYDNSTIIITADHTIENDVPKKGHIPLLIKSRNSSPVALRTVDTPVSSADIPSMVIQLAKNDSFDLASFLPLKPRYYNFYLWGNTWSSPFLPTITRYEIRGSAGDTGSYVEIGKLKPGINAFPLDGPLKIDFIHNPGAFKNNVVGGFKFDDSVGLASTWRLSHLVFSFRNVSTSHIRMLYDIVPETDKAPTVLIHGIASEDDLEVRKSIELSSSPIVFNAVNELWFQFQGIKSISSITFEPVDADEAYGIEMEKTYALSEPSAYEALIISNSGFSVREKWGVWTDRPSATLLIPWKSVPTRPVVMTIVARALVSPNWPKQQVFIYAGDILVSSRTYTKETSVKPWSIELDPRLFGGDKIWKVRFDLPDNVMPQTLGINNDNRTLAIGLHSVMFSDMTEAALESETPVTDHHN